MLELGVVAFLVPLLQASVRMATPLLLAALGETFTERAGVLNIGLEGIMLTGAFSGFAVTALTGANWMGTAVAMLAGALMGLAFAFLTVTLKANQIVVGVAVNMMGMGVTSFLYRKLFATGGASVLIQRYEPIPLPGLSELPVLGPVLFNQNIIVYATYLLVPLAALILYRTSWGLEITATGQHPRAADSVGINVFRVRYATVIVGAALAALGGSFLSMGHSSTFFENMTSGRGFIVLAVVIFGRWNPYGVLAAAIIFGLANAFQFRLQATGLDIPHHLVLMIPYAFTILAVAMASRRNTSAPGALAQPYEKA